MLLGHVERIGAGVGRAIIVDAIVARLVIDVARHHRSRWRDAVSQTVGVKRGVMGFGKNFVQRAVSEGNRRVVTEHALQQIAVGIVAAAFDLDRQRGIADIGRIVEGQRLSHRAGSVVSEGLDRGQAALRHRFFQLGQPPRGIIGHLVDVRQSVGDRGDFVGRVVAERGDLRDTCGHRLSKRLDPVRSVVNDGEAGAVRLGDRGDQLRGCILVRVGDHVADRVRPVERRQIDRDLPEAGGSKTRIVSVDYPRQRLVDIGRHRQVAIARRQRELLVAAGVGPINQVHIVELGAIRIGSGHPGQFASGGRRIVSEGHDIAVSVLHIDNPPADIRGEGLHRARLAFGVSEDIA